MLKMLNPTDNTVLKTGELFLLIHLEASFESFSFSFFHVQITS